MANERKTILREMAQDDTVNFEEGKGNRAGLQSHGGPPMAAMEKPRLRHWLVENSDKSIPFTRGPVAWRPSIRLSKGQRFVWLGDFQSTNGPELLVILRPRAQPKRPATMWTWIHQIRRHPLPIDPRSLQRSWTGHG